MNKAQEIAIMKEVLKLPEPDHKVTYDMDFTKIKVEVKVSKQ